MHASAFVCMYTSGLCVCMSTNHGDCDVKIPVEVENSIPNQLLWLMVTIEYRVLWASYTKPANLDDGDDGQNTGCCGTATPNQLLWLMVTL